MTVSCVGQVLTERLSVQFTWSLLYIFTWRWQLSCVAQFGNEMPSICRMPCILMIIILFNSAELYLDTNVFQAMRRRTRYLPETDTTYGQVHDV